MKNKIYQYQIFGQVSNPNAYGGGTYNDNASYGDTTQTGTQTGAQQPGGSLANTGVDVMMPLALGAAMIIGSVFALIKMRRGKKA